MCGSSLWMPSPNVDNKRGGGSLKDWPGVDRGERYHRYRTFWWYMHLLQMSYVRGHMVLCYAHHASKSPICQSIHAGTWGEFRNWRDRIQALTKQQRNTAKHVTGVRLCMARSTRTPEDDTTARASIARVSCRVTRTLIIETLNPSCSGLLQ